MDLLGVEENEILKVSAKLGTGVQDLLEEIVKKHVAINILKYGKPSEKAIIGKVIAECPEAKQRIKDVIELIRKTIEKY